LVERVSKKTVLSKVSAKKADLVSSSIISSLKPIANNVLTITADNGSEFAYHERISQELETDFYFAHPYSSWERGLNENTNGLIRQYLRKGCDFSSVTDNVLEFIMDRLNNRPRKSLGFATPEEVFYTNAAQ
jgi:IS30 family transposase